MGIRLTLTTKKRKELFLKALAASVGNVSRACKLAKLSKQTPYNWREADPAFAAAWDEVIEASVDAAEQELYRRAVEGVYEPVYQSGKLVGKVKKFSDTCLIFLLKGRRPQTWNPPTKIAPTDPTGTKEFAFRDPNHDGL